jgi:hypothetical protein
MEREEVEERRRRSADGQLGVGHPQFLVAL